MNYVTYDGTGALTGGYLQALHPDHAENCIPVTEAIRAEWFLYRANAGRTGVELAPPVEPVPVVPQEVTRRQAIQALRRRGVTEAMIEIEINKIPDVLTRDLALIEFRTSQVFERQRPLVIAIGTALGFDLDELFIFASGL